jgi:hypothetical protein
VTPLSIALSTSSPTVCGFVLTQLLEHLAYDRGLCPMPVADGRERVRTVRLGTCMAVFDRRMRLSLGENRMRRESLQTHARPSTAAQGHAHALCDAHAQAMEAAAAAGAGAGGRRRRQSPLLKRAAKFLAAWETCAALVTPPALASEQSASSAGGAGSPQSLSCSATQWALLIGPSAARPREVITVSFVDEAHQPLSLAAITSAHGACLAVLMRTRSQTSLEEPSLH